MPCFRPALSICFLVQTDVKGVVKGFFDGLNGNDEKVASSNKKQSKVRKPCTLFETKIARIDTKFLIKTAKKPFSLRPHTPIDIAYIGK